MLYLIGGYLTLSGPNLTQVAFLVPVPMLLLILVDFNAQAVKGEGDLRKTFVEKTVVSGKTEEGAYLPTLWKTSQTGSNTHSREINVW